MSIEPTSEVRALRLTSDGPERTRGIAAAMAATMVEGDLLVLTGDLGAGKTCFTQGLGSGLGIDERITSPTFTLANRYHGRLTLHHLDVYRLDGESDAGDLDLDELLETGVTVIEWGDRVIGLLPDERFTVTLSFPDPTDDDPDPHPDHRVIVITGPVAERDLDRVLAPLSVEPATTNASAEGVR